MGRIIEDQSFIPHPFVNQDELLSRLRPNGWDLEMLKFGYLGIEEDLNRLIEEDACVLTTLGLTHDRIATAIEVLFASDEREVNGHPILRMQYIHSPLCPWGDFCSVSPFDSSLKVTEIVVCHKEQCPKELLNDVLEAGSISIENYPQMVANNWAMIFSDLHPHLIRDHHFFEGKQTPYRVDPERVKAYLDL